MYWQWLGIVHKSLIFQVKSVFLDEYVHTVPTLHKWVVIYLSFHCFCCCCCFCCFSTLLFQQGVQIFAYHCQVQSCRFANILTMLVNHLLWENSLASNFIIIMEFGAQWITVYILSLQMDWSILFNCVLGISGIDSHQMQSK